MKEQKRYSIWDNFRYTFYLLKQVKGVPEIIPYGIAFLVFHTFLISAWCCAFS